MSLKFKISILHFIIVVVTTSFIYMIYDSYILSQQKDIEKQLMRILKLNEQHMKTSLSNIQKLIKREEALTEELHKEIHDILKSDYLSTSLSTLQKRFTKIYELENKGLDIEVFLIDKNYKIINSTHKKNIDLSLFHVKKIKDSLDSLTKIDEYIRSEHVSVDFLDYELKTYSYSLLKEELFLGMALIYKNAVDEKKSFNEMISLSNTSMNLFCIMKDSEDNQYYESLIIHKKKFSSNEEYLNSKEKFPLNKETENLIIKTSRTWEMQNSKKDDFLNVYIPLVKEKNEMMEIPGDIVLQIDLDISEQNLFIKSILNKLILFVLLHFFLVFIIFYFTNRYQKLEKKLNEENKRNEDLIEYNKQFISNLVHQIRTPLAVIMTNVSLLEVVIKKSIKQYSFQINASINMLSNSYENLSYFISYRNLNYPKKKVDLSSFIKDRISFFDDIAYANKKKIIANVEEGCKYEINDIELERLVDNSISNALYFCDYEGTVIISLNKKEDLTKIGFKVLKISKSKDINILNKKDINYMKDMSSLGLGLHLIREIVDKNKLHYSISSENEHVVFEAILYDKYITKVS